MKKPATKTHEDFLQEREKKKDEVSRSLVDAIEKMIDTKINTRLDKVNKSITDLIASQDTMNKNFNTMHKDMVSMGGAINGLEKDSALTDERMALTDECMALTDDSMALADDRMALTDKHGDGIKWVALAGIGIIAIALALKPVQDFVFY